MEGGRQKLEIIGRWNLSASKQRNIQSLQMNIHVNLHMYVVKILTIYESKEDGGPRRLGPPCRRPSLIASYRFISPVSQPVSSSGYSISSGRDGLNGAGMFRRYRSAGTRAARIRAIS